MTDDELTKRYFQGLSPRVARKIGEVSRALPLNPHFKMTAEVRQKYALLTEDLVRHAYWMHVGENIDFQRIREALYANSRFASLVPFWNAEKLDQWKIGRFG